MTVRELVTKITFAVDKALLGRTQKQVDDLKKTMDKTGEAGGKAGDKINAGTRKAASGFTSLQSTVVRVAAGMNRAIDSAEKKLDHFAKKTRGISGMAGNTTKLGINAGAAGVGMSAAGAAIMAPMAGAVAQGMDFDASISKVQAILGSKATPEGMARIEETARQLGMATKFSASEAAQAMTYLAMAGWDTNKIIAQMPGLLDLAAASGEDLSVVADIVSDDVTAFGLKGANAAKELADVMAATSSNANTNVAMMGQTFKYAASVAGSLGYTMQDTALATGLMANAGIKAEQAGTSLRSIFTRLVKPPKEAAEAFAELAFEAVDPLTGQMKPLRSSLVELRQKFRTLTDAEKGIYASTIAGQEAMSGFLALMNASDEDFGTLAKAIDGADGAAGKMASVMQDNLKGALTVIESALGEVAIAVSKELTPILKDVADGVLYVVTAFNEWRKENPELAGTLIKVAAVVGSLLVAGGALLTMFGGVLAVVGSAVSGFLSIQAALIPFGSLFAALASGGGVLAGVLSGPVGWALMAIVALIALVSANWDKLVDVWQNGGRRLRTALDGLWNDLGRILDRGVSLLRMIPGMGAIMDFSAGIADRMGMVSHGGNTVNQNNTYNITPEQFEAVQASVNSSAEDFMAYD